MRILNLGILAHVDAGKTTLTERLLYAAGVIDEIGSVDDGSTHTDSLPLERQRGITIKSAVVSFVIGDVCRSHRHDRGRQSLGDGLQHGFERRNRGLTAPLEARSSPLQGER